MWDGILNFSQGEKYRRTCFGGIWYLYPRITPNIKPRVQNGIMDSILVSYLYGVTSGLFDIWYISHTDMLFIRRKMDHSPQREFICSSRRQNGIIHWQNFQSRHVSWYFVSWTYRINVHTRLEKYANTHKKVWNGWKNVWYDEILLTSESITLTIANMFSIILLSMQGCHIFFFLILCLGEELKWFGWHHQSFVNLAFSNINSFAGRTAVIWRLGICSIAFSGIYLFLLQSMQSVFACNH